MMIWQILQFLVAFVAFFGFALTSAAFLSYVDRKLMALMQDRLGPTHVGPWGLLQPIADVAKLLLKEGIQASASDKVLFILAPSVFLAPVIGSFAVLPLSPYIGVPGTALATGIVYVVAMSSIDVLGVFMAGWGSNNKYALMGGIRAAAQMISYELPLALGLVSVVMLTSILAPNNSGIGTLAFKEIMIYQDAWHKTNIPVLDFLFAGDTPWAWFVLVQPLILVIYYICGLAETNRAPFDLAEAESELVAGHLTEYSGTRWAMFFLGEYGNMTIVSAIITFLFLGGWSGPGVTYLIGLNVPMWGWLGNILALGYLIGKIYLLCFVFTWVRATLPRLRSDQLMQFAWLVLIPVTLGNILVTALVYLVVSSMGWSNLIFLMVVGVINWVALIGFIYLVSKVTRRGTRHAQGPAVRSMSVILTKKYDVPVLTSQSTLSEVSTIFAASKLVSDTF